MFGEGNCGSWFDDSNRDPKLHMKEVQVWYDMDCIMGIRTVLTGGGAGTRENMYGEPMGSSLNLTLSWDEYITAVDIKVGK